MAEKKKGLFAKAIDKLTDRDEKEELSQAEQKVKELEDSISTFITAQRKKIKIEMSNLEEIQKLVSTQISTFMKDFR